MSALGVATLALSLALTSSIAEESVPAAPPAEVSGAEEANTPAPNEASARAEENTLSAPADANAAPNSEVTTAPAQAESVVAAEAATESGRPVGEEVALTVSAATTQDAAAEPAADSTTNGAEATEPTASIAVADAPTATPDDVPAAAVADPAVIAGESASANPIDESAQPTSEPIQPPASSSVDVRGTENLIGAVAPRSESASAQTAAEPGVVIDRFEFSYGLPHPDLPPLEELKNLVIAASRDGDTYRAPAADGAVNVTLSAVPAGARFDGDALRGIAQEVVRWYNSRGLSGVWVAYTDLESSATGVVDNRAEDNHSAHLVIWASQVAEVRTLARGKRFKPEDSINHRKHRKIVQRSPLQAGETPEAPGSLFSRDVLDEYLYGLSLHPGRRVEASIASAGQPGKVVLDYLVNEARTWQIFSQFNNYGTEGTGEYRARLGFQHNQLTNHDDVLNIDLISTPDFETYGSFVSYRFPVWRPAKLLMRVYGSYGDFLATDLSIPADSGIVLRYLGQNWLAGLELSNRLTLWRDWQLVSVLGANFNHYGLGQTINGSSLVDAESEFLVPFVGTTLSRNFRWGGLSAGVRYDQTVGDFANTDSATGIPAFGRRNADSEWSSGRWNFNGTVYLEPLFSRSAEVTLAHEVSVRLKGRIVLKGEYKRLIPHEQEPLGGAMSLRGYPESILSADETTAGTIEYGWHIPRSLRPGEEGRAFRWPFKWRPKQAGQNPDWDLIVRLFYDYAYRGVTPPPPLAGEVIDPDEQEPYVDRSFGIYSRGIGLTLLIKQNFSLRLDYGEALKQLEDSDRPLGEEVIVPKGNKQFYMLTSFSW